MISGPCAEQAGTVVGVDVEMADLTGEALLTVDVGTDFDESLKPDEVEVIDLN